MTLDPRPPLLFEETTREERLAARRAAFAHQNGLALLPLLASLARHEVLDSLGRGTSCGALAAASGARSGYLNVALRALASQGWLAGWSPPRRPADLDPGAPLSLTPRGRAALTALRKAPRLLERAEAFLPLAQDLAAWLFRGSPAPSRSLSIGALLSLRGEGWELGDVPEATRAELSGLLDGLLAAPLAVTLARNGVFRRRDRGRETRIDPQLHWPSGLPELARARMNEEVLPALRALGWLEGEGSVRLLTLGKAAVFYATAYAVSLSYLPLLRGADELLFGARAFRELFPRDADGAETHVHRPMNIWGSGGAHDLYFRAVDEVVAGLFAADDAPLAIVDTGCGDGSFLAHLHDVLRDRLRWDFLARPVWFLGSDLNRQSRERTAETLRERGVANGRVIPGAIDINRPDALAAAITALDLPVKTPEGVRALRAADALHTNSMLVHNRRYAAPESDELPPSVTDGAFVDEHGAALPTCVLQQNLVEFFGRWAPYLRRFGWLFVELHTLPAARVAEDPARTPTVAYDLTHGFSHQYTVEQAELLAAAAAAGLRPGPSEYQFSFPSEALARVSVFYLRGGAA